jgi:segregation and condensation protein B
VGAALEELAATCAPGERGLLLREAAGGYTLASDPIAEPAARALLARPRLATLTPAQLETLAIVAYLQPVSRPEIARVRGVNAESPVATLLDRSLITEAGRSEFGAVLYRTTTLFLKVFDLQSLEDLPDPAQWDATPEEEGELRDRLLAAGDARSGTTIE